MKIFLTCVAVLLSLQALAGTGDTGSASVGVKKAQGPCSEEKLLASVNAQYSKGATLTYRFAYSARNVEYKQLGSYDQYSFYLYDSIGNDPTAYVTTDLNSCSDLRPFLVF